jgi:hypothetical protein
MIALAAVALAACGPRRLPPATADQTVHDAVALVCEAPSRADADRDRPANRGDAIAKHLRDGVGNERVLVTIEGWETQGIKLDELDALLVEAKLTRCRLRDVLRSEP